MKHICKRILLLTLTTLILASVLPGALSVSAASIESAVGDDASLAGYVGVASGVEEVEFSELSDDEIISSVEDYAEFSGNSAPVVGSAASALPSECDNSTNENGIYFPPVGDQGAIGSCACWSSTYYNYTYMAHRANGIPTTETNAFSPTWTFNLSNSGSNKGSNSPRNFNVIRELGAATVEDVHPETSPYPEVNILNWHAENGIWKKAAKNRLTSYGYFTPETFTDGYNTDVNTPVPNVGTPITSADDSDLIPMKTALSNGDILCYNSFIFSWKYRTLKNGNGTDNRFVGESAVYMCDGTEGSHAMTLVGYNDNLWIDVNNNNRIDNGEMGAFKIVNSWGKVFGNRGFMWISYDAMNKVSAVSGAPVAADRQCAIDTVSLIKVEPKQYESGVYLKYVLNSAERSKTHVYVTATEKANPNNTVRKLVAPYGLDDYIIYVDTVAEHSYNGTTEACDGEMYYDLNNVVPGLDINNINDYVWSIDITDTSNNSKALTVKELKIVNDVTGGEADLLGGTTCTLNGSSKVFNAHNVNFEFSTDVKVSPTTIHTLEEVRITANARAGKTPYQYQFELEKDGVKTMLQPFCNNFECYKRLNVEGDCTIVVTVKDSDGKTAVGRRPITVKKTEITELNADKAYANKGEKVVFTPEVANLAPSFDWTNFRYTVTKDGESQTFFAQFDNSLEWTPEEGGNFTVKCDILCNNETVATKTVDYTVNANEITIYYKGYSNPNIHYQVGNGSWTAVPGIAMTATNEMSGYTHKYTIDLGNATYANVCFNDGKGNWDSRNGANYRFEKGYYKFSNGSMTKFDPTPAALSASLSFTKSEVLKNETVTMNASALNGKAPYQYKVTYAYNGSSTNYIEYTSNSEFVFTPILTGDYAFTLTVKDAAGKTATAAKNVSVKMPSISSVNTSTATGKVGESVRLSMNVVDDMSTMARSYQITRNGAETTLNAGSNGEANWTPTAAGNYTITAVLTYNGKYYQSKSITYAVDEAPANTVTIYYKGYSTPNIHYQVGNGSWTAVPGIAMTATNELSGYTHKYTINLGSVNFANVCFNDGKGNWDSRNGSNYRFEKGYYKFSNGNVTKFDPTPAGLSASLTFNKSEGLKNETVTMKATAANGTAPYQYKVTYTYNGAEFNYIEYTSEQNFVFTPIMNGNYVFNLTVKDATGKTATASKTFSAKTPSITSVNTSIASAKVGDSVKLSMTVADDMASMFRTYKITKDGITGVHPADSDGTVTWTPGEAGTYTITGVLTYNGKEYTSSKINYTVAQAPSNTITIYYKGYSTPNIHYCAGNGSWTAVPGIAMTATNEMSGYTHKYTIDLGSATYANVCFNDGKGNWDSRNGANYYFEKGTYKFSNGNIVRV